MPTADNLLDILPAEIIAMIASFLRSEDLGPFFLTCKKFNELADDIFAANNSNKSKLIEYITYLDNHRLKKLITCSNSLDSLYNIKEPLRRKLDHPQGIFSKFCKIFYGQILSAEFTTNTAELLDKLPKDSPYRSMTPPAWVMKLFKYIFYLNMFVSLYTVLFRNNPLTSICHIVVDPSLFPASNNTLHKCSGLPELVEDKQCYQLANGEERCITYSHYKSNCLEIPGNEYNAYLFCDNTIIKYWCFFFLLTAMSNFVYPFYVSARINHFLNQKFEENLPAEIKTSEQANKGLYQAGIRRMGFFESYTKLIDERDQVDSSMQIKPLSHQVENYIHTLGDKLTPKIKIE